ncbi:MAG TPA: hypothetical protein PLK52_01915 [Usitatibacteraceae bacterium]|nr:hypothetical protein [Usitatibacteraceae bacterium]HQY45775.1 hypothetical protein [Usitatibacteraceae bacterium]HRA22281.1 hypothetical protein [Usitatibacteraceae bacterium]
MSGAPQPAADQARYARLLAIGTHGGLALLVALFAIYMLGVVEPHVAHERLPELWKLPAKRLLEEAGIGGGWGWTALVARADILTLVGIVALAACSVPCLLAIMPVYWASGQRILFAICAFEVAVIALAASGLVSGGH